MPFYQTIYEWTCEIVQNDPNPDYRDILDANFGESLNELMFWGNQTHDDYDEGEIFVRYGLVKNVGNDDEGVVDRTWAYLNEDGSTPNEFENGDPVPKRFKG